MPKSKKNKPVFWLIIYGVYLFLSISYFYISFVKINVWEGSPKFKAITLGSESFLQPIIELIKVYNKFNLITSLVAFLGFLCATIASLVSYRIENKKFDKKFIITTISIIIIFLIFFVIMPPSKLSPCIGCDKLRIEFIGSQCLNNVCFECPNGETIIIKNYCNSTWIFGEINSNGKKIIYEEFKVKKDEFPCLIKKPIDC